MPAAYCVAGLNRNVVERRALCAVGNTLDTKFISGMERDSRNLPASTRISVGLVAGKMSVGEPFIDKAVADINAELRRAVVLIEIFNVQVVCAGIACEMKACIASLR